MADTHIGKLNVKRRESSENHQWPDNLPFGAADNNAFCKAPLYASHCRPASQKRLRQAIFGQSNNAHIMIKYRMVGQLDYSSQMLCLHASMQKKHTCIKLTPDLPNVNSQAAYRHRPGFTKEHPSRACPG
jgi:hypothetical protein